VRHLYWPYCTRSHASFVYPTHTQLPSWLQVCGQSCDLGRLAVHSTSVGDVWCYKGMFRRTIWLRYVHFCYALPLSHCAIVLQILIFVHNIWHRSCPSSPQRVQLHAPHPLRYDTYPCLYIRCSCWLCCNLSRAPFVHPTHTLTQLVASVWAGMWPRTIAVHCPSTGGVWCCRKRNLFVIRLLSWLHCTLVLASFMGRLVTVASCIEQSFKV
jgi:hypothetical protein